MGNRSSLFPEELNLVCDCGHEETDHLICGPCTYKDKDENKCKCGRYSQLKMRKRGQELTFNEKLELKKQFENALF